jgi:predicted ATPase/tetratricopeptide (TPR) repeat protein
LAKVLISYRRSDSAGIVGRIYDRLVARYGAEGVFLDVDKIPFGVDFREHVRERLAGADVVLAIVGSHWLGARHGHARIRDDDDPVRMEIEAALAAGTPLCPVLIDGARMPSERELPPTLSRFAYVNAAPLEAGRDFEHDVSRLIASLDALLGPKAPPPPVTTDSHEAPSSKLPRQLTSFVGRADDVAEIAALIESSALVTLVGAGGAGKTRCAVQVGAALLDGSGDGVWFADLAPLSDPALVAGSIALALGVPESPNRSSLDTLLAYLKGKRLLLIFDNCEHVIGEVRTVTGATLRGCLDVRILATSREALRITGEAVYRLPSLAVPPPNAVTAAETARCGAVELFVDRARSAERRFALSDENAPFVAEICRRLDGIPLALELAAARVTMLSPKQLAQRLDERFRVLTGGDRSALPRQQTMRALIDWSYDLLTDAEKAIFRRLSIFAGGFTLETASAVCADDTLDELAVLDLLSSLVDKSLVQSELGDIGTRYRLLESTRQYASEKLMTAGEHEAVAHAHASAYLALAERFDRSWQATPTHEWLAQAQPELENWRAALEWAFRPAGDVHLGQRLVGALHWVSLGSAREGRRWVETAQDAVDAQTAPAIAAGLDLAEAWLDGRLSLYKACYATAERALKRYRELDEPLRCADAQRLAGHALVLLGRCSAGEPLLEEALVVARRFGARKIMGYALLSLGLARFVLDDVGRARTHYAEALAVAVESENDELEAAILVSLAEAEFRDGDPITAIKVAGEAVAGYRAINDAPRAAVALANTVMYLITLGRYGDALERAREAISTLRDAQVDVVATYTLQHVAAIAALRSIESLEAAHAGRSRAARLMGYVDARLTALEAPRERSEQQEFDRVLSALRDALGIDRLAELMAEGRNWTEDQAVAQAFLV